MSRHRAPRWGQNFLVNQGLARAIVEAAAPGPDESLIGIGPGRGILTRLMAAGPGPLLAIEIDPELCALLSEELGARAGLSIRQADATGLSWAALVKEGGGRPQVLVSNLPYESATPILLAWLQASAANPLLPRAVVMVQEELANRIGAASGTRTYGSLSVLVAGTHRVERLAGAGPGSFRPRPRVRSRVLRLTRLARPLIAPEEWTTLARLVQAAFARRRKQLPVALDGLLGRDREAWRSALRGLGHPETARAEQLAPAEMIGLLRAAAASCEDGRP